MQQELIKEKKKNSIKAKVQVLQEIEWLRKELKARNGRKNTNDPDGEDEEIVMALGSGIFTKTLVSRSLDTVSLLVGADTFVEMSFDEALLFLKTREEDVVDRIKKEEKEWQEIES